MPARIRIAAGAAAILFPLVLLASQPMRSDPQQGSFDMTGYVTKHPEAGICMQGRILFDLHSLSGQHTVALATKRAQETVLARAEKSGRHVRVLGIWQQGVETGCRWVRVERVSVVR